MKDPLTANLVEFWESAEEITDVLVIVAGVPCKVDEVQVHGEDVVLTLKGINPQKYAKLGEIQMTLMVKKTTLLNTFA